MIGSKITGVGKYLPPQVLKNTDLEKMLDTSDEWIRQRTGIEQRHWVDLNSATTTSDLGLEASRMALKKAGIQPTDLDMIIFATLSPDHEFPGTACFLQDKLGVSGIPALDVRQQCTGFLYGLSIADQFIRGSGYKHVLVVGAELHSKGLDRTPRGRDVSVLFGDGAGAAIVSSTEISSTKEGSQILSTHLHADGKFAKELWIQAPGLTYAQERISVRILQETTDHFPKMNGRTVFVHATKKMVESVLEALKANQMRPNDVDLYVFHQANLRINEMVAQQLEIPESKVFNTIQKYGNTTAATIPIGLTDAVEQGKLKSGMNVILAAFGSGFTWASSLVRW